MDKRAPSPPQRWLIARCQHTNFGSVTFYIRDGAPDPNREHHITRTLKLAGGSNGPRRELASVAYELKQEHMALFALLATLPDGSRVKVKVSHGLPGPSIDVEEDHQAA